METDDDVEARIDDLVADARDARQSFEPPADPPDEATARRILREGLGPTVSLFVEVRTGGRSVYFSPETYDDLEGAMNDWLDLYAACYGVDLDGEYQLREAAQLLIDTHNVVDVAEKLTGVPEER